MMDSVDAKGIAPGSEIKNKLGLRDKVVTDINNFCVTSTVDNQSISYRLYMLRRHLLPGKEGNEEANKLQTMLTEFNTFVTEDGMQYQVSHDERRGSSTGPWTLNQSTINWTDSQGKNCLTATYQNGAGSALFLMTRKADGTVNETRMGDWNGKYPHETIDSNVITGDAPIVDIAKEILDKFNQPSTKRLRDEFPSVAEIVEARESAESAST